MRSTVVAWLALTAIEPSARSSQSSPRRPRCAIASRRRRTARRVERLPVGKTHATQTPGGVAVQRGDRRLDDRDAEGLHALELFGGEIVRAVAEEDDIVRPLAQHDGEVLGALAGGQDGEALVAVLEAVAVGAGVR